ncbi:TMED9 [Symbiodinium sp. CCMP2592]|nr:TMED9 [Symbiodinium sp. CCMP2592]
MNDKEVLPLAECRILVKSPAEEVVKDHALVDGNSGALALLPKATGTHSICVHCAAQGSSILDFGRGRKLRWSIAFDVLGASSMGLLPDPKNAASLSLLKGTQAQVDLILERINAISTENDYERSFETKFVKTSEAVNMDVAAFKFLQILLITGVAAFQIHNLAKFLQRREERWGTFWEVRSAHHAPLVGVELHPLLPALVARRVWRCLQHSQREVMAMALQHPSCGGTSSWSAASH